MSTPAGTPVSTLVQHAEQLAVVRLGPGAELPAWAYSGTLLSVTATATETSVVCAHAAVPGKARPAGPYTAFSVQGPLDLALTGVLAALVAPLAEAEVSVFTIATYDTDWLLVPAGTVGRAVEAWRRSGHEVVEPIRAVEERPSRRAPSSPSSGSAARAKPPPHPNLSGRGGT